MGLRGTGPNRGLKRRGSPGRSESMHNPARATSRSRRLVVTVLPSRVTEDAIEIREFREHDLEAIVEFSLRAWQPIFASAREVLGDDIFLRLHPDWKANQADAVRSTCTNDARDVFVAVANERPVGFVAVALNAFNERMGVIDIIGVDPDYQRRGIGLRLTEVATEHMRSRGMDIAVVETGGDPGHAPARAAYETAGFTLLPIARYFRLLD
jgi:ribosomal protein S18 acetylase RimI-like enzyme